MTIVLGIDPGLQKTGWGVISSNNHQLSFIACGTIATKSKDDMPSRLKELHDKLAEVITLYKPDEAGLEETFINVSGSSSLKLGQARGALMLTVSLASLPLYEYSATQVKKSVVGNGHASKEQIAMMVKTLLPTSDAKGADASDALAIAITHAHQRTLVNIAGAAS